jgi:hypothetical protein
MVASTAILASVFVAALPSAAAGYTLIGYRSARLTTFRLTWR